MLKFKNLNDLTIDLDPFIGKVFDDNWGLDDPTGKSDDDFKAVIQRIEENIIELKKRLSES